MQKFIAQLTAFIKDEEGASAIEYALIAGLVALVVAAGATTLGTQLSATFTAIATKLANALK
jgi:pilus assembly protein Flp/PilA